MLSPLRAVVRRPRRVVVRNHVDERTACPQRVADQARRDLRHVNVASSECCLKLSQNAIISASCEVSTSTGLLAHVSSSTVTRATSDRLTLSSPHWIHERFAVGAKRRAFVLKQDSEIFPSAGQSRHEYPPPWLKHTRQHRRQGRQGSLLGRQTGLTLLRSPTRPPPQNHGATW